MPLPNKRLLHLFWMSLGLRCTLISCPEASKQPLDLMAMVHLSAQRRIPDTLRSNSSFTIVPNLSSQCVPVLSFHSLWGLSVCSYKLPTCTWEQRRTGESYLSHELGGAQNDSAQSFPPPLRMSPNHHPQNGGLSALPHRPPSRCQDYPLEKEDSNYTWLQRTGRIQEVKEQHRKKNILQVSKTK